MTRIGVLILAAIMSSGAAGQGRKPELDLPEIIISASAPELIRGKKERIPLTGFGASVDLISGSMDRTPVAFPEMLETHDVPDIYGESGTRAPCLAGFLGPLMGVSGRMRAAARAAQKDDWGKVVELMTPITSNTGSVPEIPKALYWIGVAKQHLNDLSGSVNALERLRREYPGNQLTEHAHYKLGWIYLKSRNIERVVEITDDFRRLYPDSPLTPYVRHLKAATQYVERDYQGALETMQGIISGYPMFPDLDSIQFWIAENAFFAGRLDVAEKNYTLFITNFPGHQRIPQALYGRAFSFMDSGRADEALQDFRRLTEDFQNHPLASDAALQAGKICLLTDRQSQASGYFNRVIRETGSEHLKTEAMAWTEFERGQFRQAESLFLKAHKSPCDNHRNESLLFMAALCQFRSGNFQQSARLFESIAENSSGALAATSWANAGIAEMELGDYPAALILMNRALSSTDYFKSRVVYELFTAEILYRLGYHDRSQEMFQSLMEPDIPEAIRGEAVRGVAWNLYARKKWEDAAEMFSEYLQIFPASPYTPEMLLRQAECYFNNGRYDIARIKFDALVQGYPLHPEAFEARLMNGRILWVQEDYEGARMVIEAALRLSSGGEQRQDVRILSGDLERDTGNYPEAEKLYQMAFLDAPVSLRASEALLKQADSLYNMRRYDDAKAVYRRIVADFPRSDEAMTAQYAIGLIHFQKNDLEAYLSECFLFADTHPGTDQGALALAGAAEILVEQDRHDEAGRVYARLLSQFENVIDTQLTRFRYAQVLQNAGKTATAVENYQLLLRNHPHGLFSADAAIALGDLASDAGDYSEAFEYYENAVTGFPHHPRYSDALFKSGSLAMQAGNNDMAADRFRTLTEKFPESKYYHEAGLKLGMLLISAGEISKALDCINTAILSPDRNIAVRAYFHKAGLLEAAGETEESLKLYLKISYLFKDQREFVYRSLMQAGRMMFNQGRAAEADRIFAKARQYAGGDETNNTDLIRGSGGLE
ncbi:tetratricopeptide repeat protein [bacterium]|nr:tetratricopeptide repeat protein [candidate division CSSED10-310 bacterium]